MGSISWKLSKSWIIFRLPFNIPTPTPAPALLLGDTRELVELGGHERNLFPGFPPFSLNSALIIEPGKVGPQQNRNLPLGKHARHIIIDIRLAIKTSIWVVKAVVTKQDDY